MSMFQVLKPETCLDMWQRGIEFTNGIKIANQLILKWEIVGGSL